MWRWWFTQAFIKWIIWICKRRRTLVSFLRLLDNKTNFQLLKKINWFDSDFLGRNKRGTLASKHTKRFITFLKIWKNFNTKHLRQMPLKFIKLQFRLKASVLNVLFEIFGNFRAYSFISNADYLFLHDKQSVVMFCAIWCYLYKLKNVKNTHGEVLLLVRLKACNLILNVTLLHGCFSRFWKFTNGTKSRNASYLLNYYVPWFLWRSLWD